MGKSRNEPLGIERRTMTNLDFVKDVFDRSPDRETAPVHIVTQIVNSLLGLLILPYEKKWALHQDGTKLEDLYAAGWPEWNLVMPKPGEPKTLGKLAWHLRNAAAHGHYSFSSDSRDPREVIVTVKDKPLHGDINWIATIRADRLYKFCRRLSSYMEGKP